MKAVRRSAAGDPHIRRLVVLTVTAIVLAAGVRLAPRVASAQPATVEVTADRTRVSVGDRIALTVVMRMAEDARPDVAGIERQLGDATSLSLLVIGLPEERPLGGGQKEVRVRYEVAAFQPGPAEVPALTVTVTAADGTQNTATSSAISLTVDSVIPPNADVTDVRDLKPQLDLPFSPGVSRRALIGAAAFVAVVSLVAAGAGWLLLRRQLRAVPEAPAAAPVLTPEAIAQSELDRIASLGLLDAGDLKTYHALLATCIRRYLSDRYGFPAFAMTTTELRTQMEECGVGRWQARVVAGLLSECDAVTFAGYRPARARSDSNLSMAYEVIAMTSEGSEQIHVVEHV